jgi:DNA-binding GntR family transcriptional regulator
MTADIREADEAGPIRPVERPAPLRQSVYEALVELVVEGRLRPGQHLVETELARQLGVSRQPVREALHRLEAEGWVDLRPNQGAFVHVPTDEEVDQLLDVRELLEVETARLAAVAATDGHLARLRVICHEGEAAVEAGDTGRFVAVNTEFHAELARMAGNAVLAELAEIVGRRVLPAGGALARARVVRRAPGHGRGHRGGRRGAGVLDRAQAHRAHPGRLPPARGLTRVPLTSGRLA